MRGIFGLVGFPLTHSFSRKYFTEKFEKENLTNFVYQNFEIDHIEKFPDIIRENENLKGLNVTIPYKEKVIPYLDDLDASAQKVGAVNVIRVRAGKLRGYNSDFYGFMESIKKGLTESIKKGLILGSGGSSKAVKSSLEDLGIEYKVVSRNPVDSQISYEEANLLLKEYKLVVNCTPLGMAPKVNTFPPIDYSRISEDHFLFDLVYNPEQTLFLQQGQEKGATIMNGMEMLILQAERSWEIWNS